MGYFDVWKKQMGGTNYSEVIKTQSTDFIVYDFKNSPAYRYADLTRRDLSTEKVDIRVLNDKNTTTIKYLHFLPDFNVNVGEIVNFDKQNYIISEHELNTFGNQTKALLCNQIIHLNKDIAIPAVVNGESYGVKIFTAENEYLSSVDTKVKVTMMDNPITRKYIAPDIRFIVNHSMYGIYRIGDITFYDNGIITATCKKDSYMEGLDDLDNNIAWQSPTKDMPVDTIRNCVIEGRDEIKVGKVYKYNLSTVIANAKPMLTQNLIGDIIDVNYIDNSLIEIKALKADELITLNWDLGNNQTITKNIVTRL